jgi:fused signal recognition particle receptor
MDPENTEVQAAPPVGAAATEAEAAPATADVPAQEQAVSEAQPVPEPSPSVGEAPWLIPGGALLVLVLVGWVAARQGRATSPALEDHEAEAAGATRTSGGEAGLAARLIERMSRTRELLRDRFDQIFGTVVDERTVGLLEEALIVADVGVPTTERILQRVREEMKGGQTDAAILRESMRGEIRAIFREVERPFVLDRAADPFVVLIVGVNGSGKTTTIGKLAARFKREGHKVLLAAGDTYRAAAAEQLTIWAQRAGVDIVAQTEGADPGAVVYDALDAAKARGANVVLIDTAGRLQTKKPLMEQLAKLRRIIDKKVPGAPHQTLLVLDGTMGQNALSQARIFHEATPLTGVIVTKLDGTAKGGMVLSIATEMRLPVVFIGIGEQVDDLRPFEAEAFVTALG